MPTRFGDRGLALPSLALDRSLPRVRGKPSGPRATNEGQPLVASWHAGRDREAAGDDAERVADRAASGQRDAVESQRRQGLAWSESSNGVGDGNLAQRLSRNSGPREQDAARGRCRAGLVATTHHETRRCVARPRCIDDRPAINRRHQCHLSRHGREAHVRVDQHRAGAQRLLQRDDAGVGQCCRQRHISADVRDCCGDRQLQLAIHDGRGLYRAGVALGVVQEWIRE